MMTVACCKERSETELVKGIALELCGVCGVKAKKVNRITVEHIVENEHQNEVIDTQYHYCETPICDVVYFSNETEQYFNKKDVRVRVGIKETEEPVQICYCFDFTEQMVRGDLITKGHTAIPEFITTEIQAGNCACEVKNPSGRCCLGEVSKVVKRLLKEREGLAARERTFEPACADSRVSSSHDCCALKE
jgi:hypothetical protein